MKPTKKILKHKDKETSWVESWQENESEEQNEDKFFISDLFIQKERVKLLNTKWDLNVWEEEDDPVLHFSFEIDEYEEVDKDCLITNY